MLCLSPVSKHSVVYAQVQESLFFLSFMYLLCSYLLPLVLVMIAVVIPFLIHCKWEKGKWVHSSLFELLGT